MIWMFRMRMRPCTDRQTHMHCDCDRLKWSDLRTGLFFGKLKLFMQKRPRKTYTQDQLKSKPDSHGNDPQSSNLLRFRDIECLFTLIVCNILCFSFEIEIFDLRLRLYGRIGR